VNALVSDVMELLVLMPLFEPPDAEAAPSIFPAVAATFPLMVPLFALLVESLALNVVPFDKCHTPL
jgi:hypothetical protein